MSRLIVNHWGGIPGALLRNAELNASSSVTRHTLVHSDPTMEFRALACSDPEGTLCLDPHAAERDTLFHAFQRAGYRVVVLGASGVDRGRVPSRPAERSTGSLADPSCSMASFGVDRCSLHDGAYFRGCAAAHDDAVLREALHLLDTSEPLLLWINLLSCRDLVASRDSSSSSGKDTYTGFREEVRERKEPVLLLEALEALEREEYGSAALPCEEAYEELLDLAWERIRAIHSFVETLRPKCECTCLLASHILSLGETGTRRAGPFELHESSFLAHDGSWSLPNGCPMEKALMHVATAWGASFSRFPSPTFSCCTLVGPLVYARATLVVRGQKYAFLYSWNLEGRQFVINTVYDAANKDVPTLMDDGKALLQVPFRCLVPATAAPAPAPAGPSLPSSPPKLTSQILSSSVIRPTPIHAAPAAPPPAAAAPAAAPAAPPPP